MIKRIPIKGISRDPSGQIAADGMCADSLNVQLDMGELAPAISPKDANSRFEKLTGSVVAANDQVKGEPRYIHKGDGYENLISLLPVETIHHGVVGIAPNRFIVKSYSKVYGGQEIYTTEGPVVDIIAVGNTLVLSLSDKILYILFKDGQYNILGDRIPVPEISFRIGDMEEERVSQPPLTVEEAAEQGWSPEPGSEETNEIVAKAPNFNHEYIGAETEFGSIARKFSFKEDQYADFWRTVFDDMWGEVERLIGVQADSGKAIFPVFIRYAVRLYDGSIYSQSIPVLLGGDIEYFFATIGIFMQFYLPTDGTILKTSESMFARSASGYNIFLKSLLSNAEIFSGWEDIVTSIDIFISPQILPPQKDAGKFTVTLLYDFQNTGSRVYTIDRFHVDPFYVEDNQDEMLMLNQQTYLAKSYSLKEFNDLAGVEVRLDDLNLSADWIMSQEPLVETPGSMHQIIGGNLFKYNNRLLIAAAKQELFPGYQNIHSSKWLQETPALDFTMYFYIHGDNGDYVVTKSVEHRSERIIRNSLETYNEFFGPWIAYPDPRCYKVVLVRTYESSGTTYYGVVTYPMKAATQINIAYAFIGFGNYVSPGSYSTQVILPTVNNIWVHRDSMFAANVNNPFLFSTKNEYKFSNGNIIAIAAATVPLSEGQFGQFPLYVFTDEGVFALSVNSEGDFTLSTTVARDVILNKGALTAIEQGIYFASPRGLLLLQGSTVTKVSDLMDGPVDAMDATLQQTIGGLYFNNLDIPDADTFVSYMQGCRMAYDFVAKRIIVFNPDKDYAYVYKIDTQSWHRLCFGRKLVNPLNSYPESLITTVEEGASNQDVYDFSVPAESEGATALPGLAYTREFLLDNADVYKAVRRLKIRGRYEDGHVKWQLQGSNDGVNYVNLHSLRGPSWKWYRLAIVTLLGPKERVSYIELDYEPKFTNKIR